MTHAIDRIRRIRAPSSNPPDHVQDLFPPPRPATDMSTRNSPTGIAPISTSIFAKAKTSAEAAMFDRISLTVLLAPEAASTPIDPTMKYCNVLFVSPDPFTR